jgi:hypothetical protein
MGRDGIAFSFVAKGQGERLTEIEQRINRLLEIDPLSDPVVVKPKDGKLKVIKDEVTIGSTPESFGEVSSVPLKKRRLNRMRRPLSVREKRR